MHRPKEINLIKIKHFNVDVVEMHTFELVLVLGQICLTFQMGPCPSDTKGTTPEIEGIFIGQCNYFINVLHQSDCDVQSEGFNCSQIWIEFSGAILGNDPCDVNISSFDRLFEIATHTIKPNTSMFWSGTNNLAHQSI